MNTSIGWFVGFVALFTVACSAGADAHEVDPTSKEALRKAPSLDYGCRYTKETTGSLSDGYTQTDKTPECTMHVRCNELREPASYADGVGADGVGDVTYESSTEYTGRQDFIGTCGDPQPVSCDDYAAGDSCDQCVGKSCCAAAFSCDADPNCGAILDCVNACKDDDCAKRCMDNGDPVAAATVGALAECMTHSCSSACSE